MSQKLEHVDTELEDDGFGEADRKADRKDDRKEAVMQEQRDKKPLRGTTTGKSLGRGLAAIFGDDSGDDSEYDERRASSSEMVDIDLIVVNKEQPRKYFDEEKLKELACSIALYGVIQPLSVRKVGNNYMLIAGERRLRACKMSNIKRVPVHVIECPEDDVLTISIIENIQRDDLNAIEEAEAFKNLIDKRNCTQESLAATVNKSRSYVTNTMRLLALPGGVKENVKNGKLSSGHAKLLVGLDNAEELAAECISKKMSVRVFEKFVRESREGQSGTPSLNMMGAYGMTNGGDTSSTSSHNTHHTAAGVNLSNNRAMNDDQLGSVLGDIVGDITRRNMYSNEGKGNAHNHHVGNRGGTPIRAYSSPEEEEVSSMITRSLGLNTKLKITNSGGIVTIYCSTCEQLEGLTQLLLSVGHKDFEQDLEEDFREGGFEDFSDPFKILQKVGTDQ